MMGFSHMGRMNNFILRIKTSLITFILLCFAITILLSGYISPVWCFVGGLVTYAAVILMYMAYGSDVIDNIFPFRFRTLIPVGLLIAIATGLGSLFFNVPFLTHTFGEFHIPIFGKVELATAMVFDLGVYF